MPDNIYIYPDQNELQQATARSLPPGAALSADRAAERDGFLALGAALEAACGPLDEDALIARLQSERAEVPVDVRAAVVLPARRAEAAWQSALSVALAAAALFALARIAVQPPAAPQPRNAHIAQHEPQPSDQSNDATVIAAVPTEAAGWLDPLDEELAFAQATFESLNTSDRGVDGSLTRMNSRLEALSQELYGGSL